MSKPTTAEIRERHNSNEDLLNYSLPVLRNDRGILLNRLEAAEKQLRDTQSSLREHMRYIRYLVDHHSSTCKHKSDCSLHNMPAYKNMPCDCGLYPEF